MSFYGNAVLFCFVSFDNAGRELGLNPNSKTTLMGGLIRQD